MVIHSTKPLKWQTTFYMEPTLNALVNAASQMYAARVQEEIDQQPELYERNPEAQQFYFKGVKDVLNSIAVIKDEAPDPQILATVLEALDDEVSAVRNELSQ